MQNYDVYTDKKISDFNYFDDQIGHLLPMKLEEEEELDYDDIEELKKQQKQLKEALLSKKKIIDVEKMKKEISQISH